MLNPLAFGSGIVVVQYSGGPREAGRHSDAGLLWLWCGTVLIGSFAARAARSSRETRRRGKDSVPTDTRHRRWAGQQLGEKA